jgi:outer membrane protein assembly factor BamB
VNNDDTALEHRLELLADYLSALDRGDMAHVEAVLRQAERDEVLEDLLLEANAMYLDEEMPAVTAGEISEARQRLAGLTSPAEIEQRRPEHLSAEPHYETLLTITIPSSDEDLPSTALPRTTTLPANRRLGFLRGLQAVAAVLVVIGIVGGFYALFTSLRHGPAGRGSEPPGHGLLIAESQSGAVYALRPGNGSIIWQYQLHSYNQITNDVVIQNGVVYASSANAVVALRASDGLVIWKKEAPCPYTYSQLFVDGGRVAFNIFGMGNQSCPHSATSDSVPGGIEVLRASDGDVLWKDTQGPANYGFPNYTILGMGDGLLFTHYVGIVCPECTAEVLDALNAADGRTAWTFDTSSTGSDLINVSVTGQTVYTFTYVSSTTSFEIGVWALDTRHGAPLWHRNPSQLYGLYGWSAPAPVGQLMAVQLAAQVCVLNLADGNLQWCRETGSLPMQVSLVQGSTIFALSVQNSKSAAIYSLSAFSQAQEAPLWTRQLPMPQPNYIVGSAQFNASVLGELGHSLYIATELGMYALDTGSGQVQWHSLSNQYIEFVIATSTVGS